MIFLINLLSVVKKILTFFPLQHRPSVKRQLTIIKTPLIKFVIKVEASKYLLFIHVNQWAKVEWSDTIPISEAYILAYLKAHGFSGHILGDFSNMPLRPSVLAEAIRIYKPLILGFTAYQENIERVRLWARYVKRLDPQIKIILGGPQITFMPSFALRHMPEVDFLCRGEGEEVMLNLAKALIEGKEIATVPGLCFSQGEKIIETGPAPGAMELDLYPSPYLMNLIDLEHKQQAMILTSRGCSFNCVFCYTPRASNRTVRFHSKERVIEEMRYLKLKGIKNFWFADPNFSYSTKRLVELLEAMIENVPGISFWCQTRYDLINSELLALLKRAGANVVAYGLESANPEVLKRIKKRMDLERLSQVICLTQEKGMKVELFTMFGLPGESFEDALSTIDYVRRHKVRIEDNSVSQQMHLFFGSPITEGYSSYGIHPLPRTRPAYLSICRDFETDVMSKKEIWQVALIWGLNRQEFMEDVMAERNLFNRANFIIKNYKILASQPLSHYLLARIYLTLEEHEAALECLKVLKMDFPHHALTKEMISSPFTAFKKKRGEARLGDKVIYDCQGFLGGKMVPSTCGRYQVAILGSGELLPDFEEGIKGLRPGHWSEFPVSFPKDYNEPSLAGREVRFQVMLRQAMVPVIIERIEDLAEAPKNIYWFSEAEVLRESNENLYYMVLKNTALRALSEDLADYLNLINFYLKLGFIEKGLALINNLPENPIILGHVAHIFYINGLPQKALDILKSVQGVGDNIELIRAKSLFDLKKWDEAEKALNKIYDRNNVRLTELMAKLAIEKNLSVEEYLERFDAFLDVQIESMVKGEDYGKERTNDT